MANSANSRHETYFSPSLFSRCRFVVSFKPPADRAHRKKWHVLLGEMPDNVVTKKTVTTHDDVESGIREGRGIVILSFCHITRDYAHPTRQRTLLSSIIIHVFRITPYFGPYTNNRDRRNNDYWTAYLISWRKRKPLLATGGESSRIRG